MASMNKENGLEIDLKAGALSAGFTAVVISTNERNGLRSCAV
jgi:hypothetical protein